MRGYACSEAVDAAGTVRNRRSWRTLPRARHGPATRAPQGPHSASSEVVVTSSPPVASVAADAEAAAPTTPPGDEAGSPTISVPGPLVVIPTVQPQRDSTAAASAPVAQVAASSAESATAPPPAPPITPESPRTTDVTPPEAAAPAAESNHDQLHPQKPLDLTAANVEESSSEKPSDAGAGPSQPLPAANTVVPQVAATSPANHPPGALAKLRARFHKLIQPSKPASKPTKDVKASETAADSHNSPQTAVRIGILLPTSDESRIAKEDSQNPVSPTAARESQGSAEMAGSSTEGVPPNETLAKPPATGQIEQWPFSPQMAAKSPKASSSPAAASDFDPIPVDEYRATVAKVNDNSGALPAFHQTPAAAKPDLHATSAPSAEATTPASSNSRDAATAAARPPPTWASYPKSRPRRRRIGPRRCRSIKQRSVQTLSRITSLQSNPTQRSSPSPSSQSRERS